MKKRSRAHRQRVRMADVARLAGVSTMTVSRALRHPERVSAEVLSAVRKVLDETGYVPDLVARGLASNRSYVIAAIIPLISQPFGPALLAMSDVLRPRGYQLILGVTHYDAHQEEELVGSFLSRRVDGIVLFFGGHTRRTVELLQQSAIPLVEIWGEIPGPAPLVDVVGFSQRGAVRDLAVLLHAQGRKRIGFIGGPQKHNRRAQGRIRGYLDGLAACGVEPQPCLIEQARTFMMQEGALAFRRLIARVPDLDAICVASDILASGAMSEAQRLGYGVPDDIAVTGFDNSDIAKFLYPALTTVNVDAEDIGHQAAMLLVDRLEHGDHVDLRSMPSRRVALDYRIVEREST